MMSEELLSYPLQVRFKIMALAPQIYVEDAQGRTICYVKQKLFKLKEDIQIFSDSSKSRQVASIKANRVLDWSARYQFANQQGEKMGAVGRQGMKSLWRARYDVFNNSETVPGFNIQEENPWSKIMDSTLGEIPVLGLFMGYLFHPSYLASRPDGSPAMRMRKMPAFLESKFTVERLTELTANEEINLIYSFLMLVLLERRRG